MTDSTRETFGLFALYCLFVATIYAIEAWKVNRIMQGQDSL